MSSIAYFFDKKTIEFYRLNGSKTMNIYRPLNAKKIINFNEGDYMFFYVKEDKNYFNENGIIGYGHFKKSQVMTCRQMWSTFEEANGFNTYEEMIEAIKKTTKDKKVPTKLNSLYLEDVVFFQNPITFDEVNIEYSTRIESFINISNPQTISKIFNKAKERGMDLWSLVINDEEEKETYFDEEDVKHILFSVCDKLRLELTSWEKRKAKKILREHQIKNPEIKNIKGNKVEGYSYSKNTLKLYLPMSDHLENNSTQMLYGHASLIKSLFKKECNKNIELIIKFISEDSVEDIEKLINQ